MIRQKKFINERPPFHTTADSEMVDSVIALEFKLVSEVFT